MPKASAAPNASADAAPVVPGDGAGLPRRPPAPASATPASAIASPTPMSTVIRSPVATPTATGTTAPVEASGATIDIEPTDSAVKNSPRPVIPAVPATSASSAERASGKRVGRPRRR